MTTENASTEAPTQESQAGTEAAADAITSPVIAAAKAALEAGKDGETPTEEQKTTETTTEEQSKEGDPEKVELTDEEKAAEEAKAKEDEAKKTGAPEKYELQFPEGVTLDEPTVTEFTDIARAANLDQETTQKIADFLPKITSIMEKRQLEAIGKVVDGWADQTRADKELGKGDEAVLKETLAVANKAMVALATPELRALLNPFDAEKNPTGTGLGNHPEFIRLMYRAGVKISEDKIVTGNEPGATQKSHADRLYGTKKK